MPTLNHLTCHVEWPTSNIPFQEYGISYGNGVVESHIAVPPSSTPFAISLQSTSFIYSGLAVFVYIDGVYQCNRNRCDLKSPKRTDNPNDTGTMVEFRVRQKEVFLPNGDWIGRPWRFEPLELAHSSPEPNSRQSNPFGHHGSIHVLVLRCFYQPSKEEVSCSDIDTDGSLSPESAASPRASIGDSESVQVALEILSQHASSENGLADQTESLFDGAKESRKHKHKGSNNNEQEHHDQRSVKTTRDDSSKTPRRRTKRFSAHSQQLGQQTLRRDDHEPWSSQLPNLDNGTASPSPLEKKQNTYPRSSPSMVINIGSVTSGQTPGTGWKVYRHQRDPSGDSSTTGDCCYVISYDKDVEPTGRWHYYEPPISHSAEYNNHNPDHICNPLGGNWGRSTHKLSLEGNKQHDGWDPDDNIENTRDDTKLYNEKITSKNTNQELGSGNASPANFGELWNTNNIRKDQQIEKDMGWETTIHGQSAGAWGADNNGLEASNKGLGITKILQLHDTDNSPVYENDDAQDRSKCSPIAGEVPSSLKSISGHGTFYSSLSLILSGNYQFRAETRCVHSDPVNGSLSTQPATFRLTEHRDDDDLNGCDTDCCFLTHRVQLGIAAQYIHNTRQPTYVDNLDEPFAKFIFKYRGKGKALIHPRFSIRKLSLRPGESQTAADAVRRSDDTIDSPKDNASNLLNRGTSTDPSRNGRIDPSSETAHPFSNAETGKGRENDNDSSMIAQTVDPPEPEGNHQAGDFSIASQDCSPCGSSSGTKSLGSSPGPLIQDTLYSNSITEKDTYFYQRDLGNTDNANTEEKEIGQENEW
ncbi:hypothetical protein Egran_01761 [Elaphomyces granulatus]|uniref:Uncharacterized protein n=1 Tax=Elaphomyces granulatus TaxID=519963 RepID=A0A232M2A3_9EURO|nr:hypothetical protein Egran_01761 [Elaphomyces granulatus]